MVKTIMKLRFDESLSDSSVNMIQQILNDSCGYATQIVELYEEEEKELNGGAEYYETRL